MRRRYSVERFLETLDRIRDRIENPSFTTDVIVGFPGETDAEFRETFDVCEAAGFLKIHAFPFSPRSGTPAASMPNQVHGVVRQRRMRMLMELEGRLAARYHTKLVGSPCEVLVEGWSSLRAGWVEGTDRRYATVECPGTAADFNQIVHVRGTSAEVRCLSGVRIGAGTPE
jgi:threonylcarbamoyladenosine tRNA methylthiotransferase MtaB